VTTTWIPDATFWTDQFSTRTSGHTAPELFKAIVPSTAVTSGDVLNGVHALRQAKLANTTTTAKVRVYVGEDRRDDLVEPVMTAKTWPENNGFVAGIQNLVGAERFSLVVNNLETTSEHLATGLGKLLAAVFDGWGVPIGGAEQVAFIGNYSGTAFGVHEGFEDAFLVHLGPGVKNFYCWAPEVYIKYTGTTEPLFGNYKWLLEHGQLFVMEPGDVLFLPRRVYHVGRQNEFSISVALPMYTYPDARLLRFAVMPEILDAILGEEQAMLTPSPMHNQDAGWKPAAARLAPAVREALHKAADGLDDLVAAAIARRWNATLSNGGWEVVEADLARDAAVAALDDAHITPGVTVRLRPPYQLCVDEFAGVHLRGAAVDTSTGPIPPALADQLNAGETVTVSDHDAGLATIRALAATGGLTVMPAVPAK